MKALVKRESQRGLWLEDVPEPEVGINDVLIRVDRTGICGTDLHIYKWDDWARATIPIPMVIGHEFVGEVVKTGSNVNDFFPGGNCQRGGPCGLWEVPELSGRTSAPL
jgi:threonine 3-dehydrogenase